MDEALRFGILLNEARLQARLNLIVKNLTPIAIKENEEYTPFLTDELYERTVNRSGGATGEIRLTNLIKDLHSFFPNGRFELQKMIHRAMVQAMLLQILGEEDYKRCWKRVCVQYELDDPVQNACVIAARRGGKSVGIGAFFATFLANVPSKRIVSFSGGKDSACEFIQVVCTELDKIDRPLKVRVSKQQATVFHGPNIQSYITAFPSGGHSFNVSLFYSNNRACHALKSRNHRLVHFFIS
jgi:hypothetical protein